MTRQPSAPRAAIYARVSTKKDEQKRALENHEARLRDYAKARGFALEERHVFLDQASGTTDDRVRYQAMKTAARARQIDVVVTTKLDRLARSLKELVGFAAELAALGVELIVVDQQMDTTTPGGRLLFHVLAAVAEFESGMISDRVTRGLERARAKGRVLGRPVPEVDLEEARRRAAGGESLRKIAADLPATIRGKPGRVSATWLSRRLAGAAARA